MGLLCVYVKNRRSFTVIYNTDTNIKLESTEFTPKK